MARLVAGAPAGPVVLDVGCGRGLTVDFLRKAGVDCRGVELAGVEPLPDVRPFVSASQDAFALPAAARLFDLEQRLLPAGWYGTSLWGVADR